MFGSPASSDEVLVRFHDSVLGNSALLARWLACMHRPPRQNEKRRIGFAKRFARAIRIATRTRIAAAFGLQNTGVRPGGLEDHEYLDRKAPEAAPQRHCVWVPLAGVYKAVKWDA